MDMTRNLLELLTKPEIAALCRKQLKIPRTHRATKGRTMDFIALNATETIRAEIAALAKSKRSKFDAELVQIPSRKRKRDEDDENEPFLQLPSPDVKRKCYRAFYERTGNVMFGTRICGSCARMFYKHEDVDFDTLVEIQSIPNRHRLIPTKSHAGHQLVEDMLLDAEAIITMDDGSRRIYLCRECKTDLSKPGSATCDKPPKYSLANGLWTGVSPDILLNLTIPEQLLISLYFTRAYVFKLYPRGGCGGDPSTLQSGIRGNVCSYPLNTEAIAAMIDGQYLPQPTSLLASIIAVTFIGTSRLPTDWMKSILKVRRHAVRDALVFLKANNRHYKTIDIEFSRLDALPRDDVPDEVMAVIRHMDDPSILDKENDNYAPGARDSADDGVDYQESTVIPLELAGVIDAESTNITYTDLLDWGMSNLAGKNKEAGYAIVYGSKFGDMWGSGDDDDNYYEKAYPCLFPYGEGGIHRARSVRLDLLSHTRYLLKLADKRFRTHETFPFVVFNSYARQQAFKSADLQMKRSDFMKDAISISSITIDMLKQAIEEEEAHKPISNETIRKLKKHVTVTGGRVIGSDQSRYKWKSQIWSTSLVYGPPTLWMTINPSDLHDPIAQVFCGENIDLDNFSHLLGPNKLSRAQNIAKDPYAASQFFHYIVDAVLETLFGVKVARAGHNIDIDMGNLGRITAYFGVVESQGRGTLHLHIVLWLKNTPTPERMRELLKTQEFRDRVKEYISHNFRAHLPDECGDIEEPDAEKDIAYSRPIHPDHPNLEEELVKFERRVAKTEQYHVCHPRRCLVPDKKAGGTRCKRGAPFEQAEDDWVDENGLWGMKRNDPHFNGWVPIITRTMRCNNDGKLLTNGDDSKNVTYYISGYMTKSQGGPYNASAVIAEGFESHRKYPRPDYALSLQKNNRLLVYRILTSLNRHREFSGPMVMSYLTGQGDVFRSHTYSPIYWTSFVAHLLRCFPELQKLKGGSISIPPADQGQESVLPASDATNISDPGAVETHPPDDQAQGSELPSSNAANPGAIEAHGDSIHGRANVPLGFDSNGKLYAKSQVMDYTKRSASMENWNILEFFTHSYEDDVPKGSRNIDQETEVKVNRNRNIRCRYMDDHPRHASKWRVVRSDGHRNLPNIIGKWITRKNDPSTYTYYCACILMLLKPWRALDKIKQHHQSWEAAHDEFIATASADKKFVISSIQYFHECQIAADRDKTDYHKGDDHNPLIRGGQFDDDDFDEEEEDLETAVQFSEEGLQILIDRLTPHDEEMHGFLAVEKGRHTGIFSMDEGDWAITGPDSAARLATPTDIALIHKWQQELEQFSVNAETNDGVRETTGGSFPGNDSEPNQGSVRPLETMDVVSERNNDWEIDPGTNEMSLTAVDVECLNTEQKRAYDLVTWHLEQQVQSRDPPPLRLLLVGEGGTGKSKVIQCITEAFRTRGRQEWLVKAAYTGIAASLIDGKTTHKISGAVVNNMKALPKATTLKKLEEFWRNRRYLIIDEMSMISRRFIETLSTNISIAKQASADYLKDTSFGGVSVILAGDFHQFPPVAYQGGPLYYPADILKDPIDVQKGRKIFEEFTQVCILKTQMRNKDVQWAGILTRLRQGALPDSDIKVLESLVLGNKDCPETDFNQAPWKDAALVTPRHGVRRRWNHAALRRWCEKSGNHLYICNAHDTYLGKGLSLPEKYGLASRKKTDSSSKSDLPDVLELAIGMKVMITENVDTDLDIANGARGVIEDIILHPEEPISETSSCQVTLKYTPKCVLVRLNKTRIGTLETLGPNVIPLAPREQKFQIKVQVGVNETVKRQLVRKQFPLTAAYAFTDYRSQGQTLPHVIIDIATPPTGGLNLFNLYVALSRSTGKDNVRLLREFDPRWFRAHHDTRLSLEDDRLAQLDQETSERWTQLQDKVS